MAPRVPSISTIFVFLLLLIVTDMSFFMPNTIIFPSFHYKKGLVSLRDRGLRDHVIAIPIVLLFVKERVSLEGNDMASLANAGVKDHA
ncbi:hypothetical protein Lal_00042368 [Lupinus albus]|nr:hypothetical protein Lal_00042368 [Lupinus albus]